jgi:3-methyladenine DNA glycosylase Mpg
VAGAVLLRGAEPVAGLALEARRLAGPGLLCLAMGITTAHTGLDLLRGPLTIRDAPPVPARLVGRGPRVGLSPGPTAALPWRTWVRGSAGVSRR